MDDSSRKGFSECIEALHLAFGAEATKASFLAYWMGLCDLELSDVQQSVLECVRECKFLPRPADVRERIVGSADLHCEKAWSLVLKAISYGAYRHVDFTDGAINATIRNMGGWPAFVGRFSDSESEKWVRLEFFKAYKVLSKKRLSDEAIAGLPGLSEASVVEGRIETPVTVRIGDMNYKRLNQKGVEPCRLENGSVR